MKTFIAILTLAMNLSSAFADSRIVGRLEAGCPVQAQVIHFKSHLGEKLLIVEDRKVHELDLYMKKAGITFFKSLFSTSYPPTFEAKIMSPLMSRLSEVTVYNSGLSADCLIDVL